ncbi:anaphase-promoting complex, cyclosome, subunit 4-domain-containing protein [Geranomyces variabilis]|nr:anaphase-promoting complex, cyclosome, subunit 4-domain-containing protein [Geranomyces variabilis]KAJ3139891.1 Anaphase-promoting complex subunit 4 [Geranomyces variabilis]
MDSLELWTEQAFHSPVTLLRWSPGKDLLAVVQDSGDVDVFRVPSWTVVFSLPAATTDANPSKPCAFSWKPNGQTVAIGFRDGTVSIYSVESGQELYVLRDANEAPEDIEWVDWEARSHGYKRPVTLFTELDEVALGPLPGLDSPSKDEYGVPARGTLTIQEDKPESFFFTADVAGLITLNLAGVLPVGTVKIADVFPTQDSPKLLNKWLAPDLSNFAALVANKTHTEQGAVEDICLLEFCFQLSDADRAPLQRATAHLEHINRLVNFIAETLQAVEKSWTAAFQLARKEIAAFEMLMEEHAVETDLVLELLNLLLTGVPSTILESYLVQRLHNGHGLKTWQKGFEAAIHNLKRVVCLQLLSGAERLLLHLQALRGLGTWSKLRGTAGFEVDQVVALADITRHIALRAERIQVEAMEMKTGFAEFSRWLAAVGHSIDTETPLNTEDFKLSKIIRYIRQYLQTNPESKKQTSLGVGLPSVDQEAFSAFVTEAVDTIREGRKHILSSSGSATLPSLRMRSSIRLQRRNVQNLPDDKRNVLTAYRMCAGFKYSAIILPSGDHDILCIVRTNTVKTGDGCDDIAYARLAAETGLPVYRVLDVDYFDESHLIVLHHSLSSDGDLMSEFSTYRYKELHFEELTSQAQQMGLSELDGKLQRQGLDGIPLLQAMATFPMPPDSAQFQINERKATLALLDTERRRISVYISDE